MTKSVITEALRPIELHQVDRLALSQKLEDAQAGQKYRCLRR